MAPIPPDADLVRRFAADLAALGNEEGRIAIAVSGGPDSLALLLLAAAARPGEVEAASVDHGLRAESADEAAAVAALCRELGVPHQVLRAAPDAGNVQAEARRARYAALAGWMRARGLDVLLTGHHADDQAETLMMRLLRGSGVAGLAGVRARGTVPDAPGLRLLRPLLGWRRDELAGLCAACGAEPAQDPSNRDERFDRARLRARLAEAPWIDPAALARSAGLLAEAEEALGWAAERHWRDAVREDGPALVYTPGDAPQEVRLRVLKRAIEAFSGPVPRGGELARLEAALRRGESATLSGVLARGGGEWRLEPAPPRRG